MSLSDTLLIFVFCVYTFIFVTKGEYMCGNSSFECHNEVCIHGDQVCDGIVQCPYGSDERFCGGCPQTWFVWGEHLYFLNSDKVDYATARTACEDMGITLTSVHSDEELFFHRMLAREAGTQVWIGFNDLTDEGNFTWLDGSPVDYTNWNFGEPNDLFDPGGEDCTNLYFESGEWNDFPCIWDNGYVCKKEIQGGAEEIELLLKGDHDYIQKVNQGSCEMPLGLSTHVISDDQISASSYRDEDYLPHFARLFHQFYWAPNDNDDSPWLQVSFHRRTIISGIVTDGEWTNENGWIWLRHFYVMYSGDGHLWKPYLYDTDEEKCGAVRCQRRHIDENEVTVFTNLHACRRVVSLYQHIKTMHIRVYPIRVLETITKGPITPESERGIVGVRLELLGCFDSDCDYAIGVSSGGITNVDKGSSSLYNETFAANAAKLKLIYEIGIPGTGWIPAEQDTDPTLELNLGDVYIIRALVTQGCGDLEFWVTGYCVSFTVGNSLMTFVEGAGSEECSVFEGNSDSTTLARNDLAEEIEADHLYLHPVTWYERPCLRVEPIGCVSGRRRCEMDHLASCDYTRQCTYDKGRISSIGFPNPYSQRSTCSWHITTAAGTYIVLSFGHFDVPSLGQCDSSSLSIYNAHSDHNSESILGNFCNDQRPVDEIFSDFNYLFLKFHSGAEEAGTGFSADYEQRRRDNAPYIPAVPEQYCPPGWNFYKDNCYLVVTSPTVLRWNDAETQCVEEGAHLVSIRDTEDMEFIYSLVVGDLASSASPPFKVYIGLTLQPDGWERRWVDGRPLSYTDWQVPKSTNDWSVRQPDGGNLESCVVMDMANFHSTDHWHDVPCVANNNANQFICMKPITRNAEDHTSSPLAIAIRDLVQKDQPCPMNMVTCDSGECLHKVFACEHGSRCFASDQCKQDEQIHSDDIVAMPRGDCGIGMFKCSRSGECISISFLCDFIINCHDGSDEDQCVYPACKEDEYTCSDSQCIDTSKRCDLIEDCTTGSDEELCVESSVGFQCYDGTWLPAHAYCDGQRDCAGKNWEDEPLHCEMNNTDFKCEKDGITCKNGACVESSKRCLYGRDKYNFQMGCRDSTHLEHCADFSCPNDTLKCPNSYCIPLRYRCDGDWDCPNGGDEVDCSAYQCPGSYRCHGSTNCVTQAQVCDGVRDCLEGDDELFCGLTCMDTCTCIGLYISCNGSPWNRTHHLNIPESRELHLTYLHLAEELKAKDTIKDRLLIDLANMPFLTILNMTGNGITSISWQTFENNPNMRILSLARNSIVYLTNSTFSRLMNLIFIDISGNPLQDIAVGSFTNLHQLLFLDIQDTALRSGKKDAFSDLSVLQKLHSDKYLFCCLVQDIESITQCLPQPDQFSSCQDLIRTPVLRIFMWILGISAILGNAFVLSQRIRPNKSSRSNNTRRVQGIMIGHLALADSLMGVYMLIVASADVYYRDRYAFFAENWQTSFLCKIAGFLSVLSSESSVFFMMVISLDRFVNIMFPFRRLTLHPTSAQCSACLIWLMTFTIALIPVLARGYFGNAFYGRSTVCLALPLTTNRPQGWQYSMTVFLGINLIAFMIMAACYVSIYFKAKTSSVSAGRGDEARSSQIQLALRMSFLVFSDMCCWMPIIVMGILSLTRAIEIPASSYAWTAVFVLPLNSSLNPYLYTILTRKLQQRQRNKSMMSTSSLSVINPTKECTFTNEANGIKSSTGDNEIDPDVMRRVHTMVVHNVLLENMGYPTIKKLAVNGGITKANVKSLEYDLQMAVEYLHNTVLLSSDCIQEDRIVVRRISSDLMHAYIIVPNKLSEYIISGRSNDQDVETTEESNHILELSLAKTRKILQLISELATE